MDSTLAELLGETVTSDNNNLAVATDYNNDSSPNQNAKWGGRKREDIITDVELASVLKRLNPSYTLTSDALLLLTVLYRESIHLLVHFNTDEQHLTLDNVHTNLLRLLIPPPLHARCIEAGTLALGILQGTVQVAPSVNLRFIHLRTSIPGGKLPDKPNQSTNAGGGYLVTLSRKEFLHETLSAACKALHFEDRKTTIFLYRGMVVEGNHTSDDLGIIQKGTIYVVNKQWWDYQRREEARRGVLTSTKSNDAAVRGFKEKATSKVALAVQQSYSPNSSMVDNAGDTNIDEQDHSSTGEPSNVSRLVRMRGLPEPSAGKKLDFQSIDTNISPHRSISPTRNRNTSPHTISLNRTNQRSISNSPNRTRNNSGTDNDTASPRLTSKSSANGGNLVELPYKIAKGLYLVSNSSMQKLEETLPILQGSAISLNSAIQDINGNVTQNNGVASVLLDIKAYKNAAMLIQTTGKELLVAITTIENTASKRAVQEQTRKYAERVSSKSINNANNRSTSNINRPSNGRTGITSPSKVISSSSSSNPYAQSLSPLKQRAQDQLQKLEKSIANSPNQPLTTNSPRTISPTKRPVPISPSLTTHQYSSTTILSSPSGGKVSSHIPQPTNQVTSSVPASNIPSRTSPEAKQATLNRLKGKGPPPGVSMIPQPRRSITNPSNQQLTTTVVWDGPGPEYNPAPIPQVKISGAIFSSKLRFSGPSKESNGSNT